MRGVGQCRVPAWHQSALPGQPVDSSGSRLSGSYVPVTTQRPLSVRQPTKINRSTTKVLSPDQIPTSPQPYANDNQISGRNPISALTTVAVA